MKYIAAISILATLATAGPTWGSSETALGSMRLSQVEDVFIPCMKNCAMETRSCTSQPGPVASSCAHNLATCMLKCQKMIFPNPLAMLNECTMVAVDELASGMDMDMMKAHMKSCITSK